jgi:hypothetical protein
MKTKFILGISLLISLLVIFDACKKKDAGPVDDGSSALYNELYQCAKDTAGMVWYKFDDTIMSRGPGSGHYLPRLRTRYNVTAKAYLDGSGKVIPGTVFPDGSLIVKELFDTLNNHIQYAVMRKATGSPFADTYGWVWGVYRTAGNYLNGTYVEATVASKGVECVGCHSGLSGNIDLTTMNYSHP